MVWTTIPDSDIDPDSPITTGLMTAYRDNFPALAAGLSGAPLIQTAALEQTASSEAVTQACIRAAAVGQAELKSTTASQSASVSSGGYGEVTLTGASYTMAWFCGNNSTYYKDCIAPNSGTYTTKVRVEDKNALGTHTMYVYSRYIQASPPYDLGNGDIALFIMARINTITKEIIETFIAQDPPWAYNSNFNNHPIHGKLQKALGLRGKNIKAIFDGTDTSMQPQQVLALISQMNDIKRNPAAFQTILNEPFTMEEKLEGMYQMPHTFAPLAADEAYIMIDPVGALTDSLAILHEEMGNSEGFSISNLLHDKYIEIGTEQNAFTPPGIIAVSAKWKNTI